MQIDEAYKSLTEDARSRAISACVATAHGLGLQASDAYVRQIMLGKRAKGCSEGIARVISAHFRGYIGIDVSPEEVIIKASGEKNARSRVAT